MWSPDLSEPFTDFQTLLQISKTIIKSYHTLMLSLHLHIMLSLISLFISFLHIVSIDEPQVLTDITKTSCKCSNILYPVCLLASNWMCWQLITARGGSGMTSALVKVKEVDFMSTADMLIVS